MNKRSCLSRKSQEKREAPKKMSKSYPRSNSMCSHMLLLSTYIITVDRYNFLIIDRVHGVHGVHRPIQYLVTGKK